ncbi:hypothetical protein GCM10022287_03070 [Gryllotalpicola koreensis]|uniref:Uncharacterized protein n=1 Tax=Gryllotalpicola koreensis TaxID=993086 RepID=A0ABP7ZQW5_9MICO
MGDETDAGARLSLMKRDVGPRWERAFRIADAIRRWLAQPGGDVESHSENGGSTHVVSKDVNEHAEPPIVLGELPG